MNQEICCSYHGYQAADSTLDSPRGCYVYVLPYYAPLSWNTPHWLLLGQSFNAGRNASLLIKIVSALVYAVCDLSVWHRILFAIINILQFINCELFLFLFLSLWCFTAEAHQWTLNRWFAVTWFNDARKSGRKWRKVIGKDRNRVFKRVWGACTQQVISKIGKTCRIWSVHTEEKWNFQPLVGFPVDPSSKCFSRYGLWVSCTWVCECMFVCVWGMCTIRYTGRGVSYLRQTQRHGEVTHNWSWN